MKPYTDGADKVVEDALDQKLYEFLENFYEIAWDRGFENQAMLRPGVFFTTHLEELKKVIKNEV
jgi:hypothetical protein